MMETDKNCSPLSDSLGWKSAQVSRRSASEVLGRPPQQVIENLTARWVEWRQDQVIVIYHPGDAFQDVFDAFAYLRQHREADLKKFFSAVKGLAIGGNNFKVLGIDDIATAKKIITIKYGVDMVTLGKRRWECGDGLAGYSPVHKF